MPPRKSHRFVVSPGAFLTFVLLVISGGIHAPPAIAPIGESPIPRAAGGGLYFDYLVIVVLENKNLCDVLTYCGGFAPYLTSLSDTYGLADENRYCNVNPSLPNYLCLTGASDFGCAGYSGNPNSNNCTGNAWRAPNIVDRLEAGSLTWKAYMEDMPSNCYPVNSGQYAVRHNPFVYYRSIAGNSTRCARVVPSGNAASALLSDLTSTAAASNYMWFSPNLCNDMHDCSMSVGDTYMSTLVPKILNSPIFQTTRAALLVTFDEGYRFPIYTVWAGPVAKTGYVSSYPYTHFSLLATIESNWNLTYLTANDRDAPHMGEFFLGQPSRGFNNPPPHPLPLPYVVGISGVAGAAVIVVSLFLFRRERGERLAREHS